MSTNDHPHWVALTEQKNDLEDLLLTEAHDLQDLLFTRVLLISLILQSLLLIDTYTVASYFRSYQLKHRSRQIKNQEQDIPL